MGKCKATPKTSDMLIAHVSDLSELQQNERNNIKLYVKHVFLIPQVSCGPVDNIFLAQV